jgi:hypothetical protein
VVSGGGGKEEEGEAEAEAEEEEGKVAATSFMSEAGGFYLGSVGLLGEYCPTTRKRQKPLLDCRSSPGGGSLHVVAKLHWCQRKRSTTSVTTSIAAVS